MTDHSTASGSQEVVPILMPQAGNSMEEGTVYQWFVNEGDRVELGQVLCEIETDKATIDYESPAAGRLARIVAELNEPIPVKQLIAVLAENDESADAFLAGEGVTSEAAKDSAFRVDKVESTANHASHSIARPSGNAGSRLKASPAARKLAAERGVAVEAIDTGSGPGGRILSGDIPESIAAEPIDASASGERRPLSKMRRAIGINLQQSKQTIPHFYLSMTINADVLHAYYREQQSSVGCSLNDLIVLAVGRAMRDFPAVRSQIDGDHIVEFPHANLGIAVGMDDGLIVPVVMNVDTLSLADVTKEVKRVVEAARRGVLENIAKGVFTISNLGMFGVEEFSAIINPPESGILAVSALREVVIVENGWMRPGRVMTLTLSADHRVVDGLIGAKFMGRLKEILEHPASELN